MTTGSVVLVFLMYDGVVDAIDRTLNGMPEEFIAPPYRGKDLERAYFYFSVARPPESESEDEFDPLLYSSVHTQAGWARAAGRYREAKRIVREAVRKAETEGRAVWVDRKAYAGADCDPLWENFNRFLRDSGLPLIELPGPDEIGLGYFLYYNVEVAVASQGLPFRVVGYVGH